MKELSCFIKESLFSKVKDKIKDTFYRKVYNWKPAKELIDELIEEVSEKFPGYYIEFKTGKELKSIDNCYTTEYMKELYTDAKYESYYNNVGTFVLYSAKYKNGDKCVEASGFHFDSSKTDTDYANKDSWNPNGAMREFFLWVVDCAIEFLEKGKTTYKENLKLNGEAKIKFVKL